MIRLIEVVNNNRQREGKRSVLLMSTAVPNSPKTPALGGGKQETHSDSEEDTSDDEEVLETAQNGRWQKLNVQVSIYVFCTYSTLVNGAFDF